MSHAMCMTAPHLAKRPQSICSFLWSITGQSAMLGDPGIRRDQTTKSRMKTPKFFQKPTPKKNRMIQKPKKKKTNQRINESSANQSIISKWVIPRKSIKMFLETQVQLKIDAVVFLPLGSPPAIRDREIRLVAGHAEGVAQQSHNSPCV